MRLFIRGVKNAFRNSIRTLSVTMILALSIGLALIMLLSYQTVQARIASVKQSVGNTISVNPAGARGFEGGGEPLTQDQVTIIQKIDHVQSVIENLQDRLNAGDNNNLTSAIDPGSLGNRTARQNQRQFSAVAPSTSSSNTQNEPPRNFSIPITVTGTNNLDILSSGSTSLIAGQIFAGDSSENVAVLGKQLATKNNLAVDSTFTAYGQTIKVVGIYDAGNEFANAGMYMPIKTVQNLSDQATAISNLTVMADNIENVDGVVSSIKTQIGTDKVDVSSTKDQADSAITPLENIRTISLYSLIGSLVAGAIITLLIMMMIVRERRREIGVLKAIGSSNIGIVSQFAVESLVLTMMGSVIGIVLGVSLSNPVLSVLVNNSTSSAATAGGPGGRGLERVAAFGGQFGGGIRNVVSNLHANAGINVILYGLLAAFLIAVIGSAIPAWLIAKVKPAEVMRAE